MPQTARKNYIKTLLSVAAPALLLGAFAILLGGSIGIFLAPFGAAFLALVFALENPKRRIVSVLLSVAFLAEDLFVFIDPKTFFCGISLLLILPALLLALLFHRKWRRADCSAALMILTSLLLLLSLWLSLASLAGSFRAADIAACFGELTENLREQMLASYGVMIKQYPSLYSSVDSASLEETVDAQISSVFSIAVAILAWAGMCFVYFMRRVFCARMRSVTGIKKHPVYSDMIFAAPVAYLFFILFIAEIFAASSSSLFARILENVYLILLPLFAYIGWRGALSVLRGVGKSWILVPLLIGLLLFGNFVIRLLACFGAFANISFIRSLRVPGDPGDPGNE